MLPWKSRCLMLVLGRGGTCGVFVGVGTCMLQHYGDNIHFCLFFGIELGYRGRWVARACAPRSRMWLWARLMEVNALLTRRV